MRGRWLCLVVLLGAPAVPFAAAAQPSEEEARETARAHFDRGNGLMENENWEMALLEFQRSYATYPTRSALFNLAMCEKALHRYRAALGHFFEWQTGYADAAQESERQSVRRAIEELREYLGQLVVETDPPGATVSVGGEVVGTTPFGGPMSVDIGRHELEIALEGFETARREVLIVPLETVELAVMLTPAGGTVGVVERPPVEPPVEPPPVELPPPVAGIEDEEDAGISQAWFWTCASVAVAAGAAAGVAGWLVLEQEDDLTQMRTDCAAGDTGACNEGRRKLDDYDASVNATNVMIGMAGTLAATALVLAFFTDFDFGGEEEPPRVLVTAGPAGDGTGAAVGLTLWF